MTRLEAVAVARTWIATPYVLHGRVKGAGADCATFLAEVLIECGIVKRPDVENFGFYSHDWFLHCSDERYLLQVVRHARRIAELAGPKAKKPMPGCIALYRVGKTKVFNHGAFITNWPFGIHAQKNGVREVNLQQSSLTQAAIMELFDPFEEE